MCKIPKGHNLQCKHNKNTTKDKHKYANDCFRLQSYFVLAAWLATFFIDKDLNINFNLSAETNLGVACRCSSVRRDLNTVLLSFIDEQNCSHTYVLPNIAIILAAAESSFGNLSRGRNV